MRGYCPNCKEYRSDDGSDAWGFVWKNGVPMCRRCSHLVELFNNKQANTKRKRDEKRGINKRIERERKNR